MARYSQGVLFGGQAITKDGQIMTTEEAIADLNEIEDMRKKRLNPLDSDAKILRDQLEKLMRIIVLYEYTGKIDCSRHCVIETRLILDKTNPARAKACQ